MLSGLVFDTPVILGIVAVLVCLAVGGYFMMRSGAVAVKTQDEGFGATSPGTMDQLSSSHVPTEEDEEAAAASMVQAQNEADDMTHEQAPV